MTRPDPAALTAATAIAGHLADPRATSAATGTPATGRGWPQSLAGGAAGIALLHIERARSGHGDWSTARTWLTLAARDELSAAANASLFFGVPALAFITHAAAAGQPGSYRRALTALDASTAAVTRRRLADAHTRIARGERPPMAEFDVIAGLTGLGLFHFKRHPDHDLTRDVLSYLVRLTEPLPGRGNGLPGWWTDVSPDGAPSPHYPGGHGNAGMSHGISSGLALLSLTLLHDVAVDGQPEAISRICAWTDEWRQEHPSGPWWPGFITAGHVRARRVEQANHPRPSWCYGVSGTARAQQLAALALKDPARQDTAEAAMLGALRDAAQMDLITGTGLCHGKAGMLQAACRMADDARTPDIASELPGLAARLAAELDHATDDDMELLDGAAGAALALHTAGTGTAPATCWDACLALA